MVLDRYWPGLGGGRLDDLGVCAVAQGDQASFDFRVLLPSVCCSEQANCLVPGARPGEVIGVVQHGTDISFLFNQSHGRLPMDKDKKIVTHFFAVLHIMR